jgi:ABC-type nitrate/sulfonate/bicarbonate transport system substrate-binding protein
MSFNHVRFWLTRIAAGALMLGLVQSVSRAADPDVVRLTFSPGVYDTLPLMIAIDKGYFKQVNLDVRVTKWFASHALLIPYLARNDIDVAPQVMAPGFFNQAADGFGVKAVTTLDETHKGWNDTVWFMVRQDLWDSKKIRNASDLRGAKMPRPTAGGPNDFLSLELLAKAGLTMSNVAMNVSLKTTADYLPAMMNKQFDAMSVPEPIATQFEKMGIAHRWLGFQDVVPYYQTGYIAASPQFAKEHRDALQRFVQAYLRACRDIEDAHGKWTPEMLETEVRWSGQDPTVIAKIPGPAYPGVGKFSIESISRQQDLWLQLGLVKKRVSIKDLIDDSYGRSASTTAPQTR